MFLQFHLFGVFSFRSYKTFDFSSCFPGGAHVLSPLRVCKLSGGRVHASSSVNAYAWIVVDDQ